VSGDLAGIGAMVPSIAGEDASGGELATLGATVFVSTDFAGDAGSL